MDVRADLRELRSRLLCRTRKNFGSKEEEFYQKRRSHDTIHATGEEKLAFQEEVDFVGFWPVRGFPATQRETRGSPALCVSGSFQGNQRVFGAPFCFSRVSLGKLASFPESESWSGAKSGAKLRKSARYPGIFQVYRGFPGIPAKYPVFCRFWPQNSLRHGSEPPQNDEFHGVSPGFPEETRGCCRETSRKHGKETR